MKGKYSKDNTSGIITQRVTEYWKNSAILKVVHATVNDSVFHRKLISKQSVSVDVNMSFMYSFSNVYMGYQWLTSTTEETQLH